MSGWNYRVVRTRIPERGRIKAVRIAIHEVYYDDAGEPNGYTENPSHPEGATEQEFNEDFLHYRMARRRPILDEKDFKRPTPRKER